MMRASGAHTAFSAGNPSAPTWAEIISPLARQCPVESPQLLADFTPLVAMLKSFGGAGARDGGALTG